VVGVGLAGEWFVGRDDLDWCGGFPVSEAGEVEGWGRRGFFVDDCQRAGGGHSGYCSGIVDLFFGFIWRVRLMGYQTTTRRPRWSTNGSKSLSLCSRSYPLSIHRVAITVSIVLRTVTPRLRSARKFRAA
jgi:hypothetical protein